MEEELIHPRILPGVWLPLYTTEISKACLISLLAFHPLKQIDSIFFLFLLFFFLNSCMFEF